MVSGLDTQNGSLILQPQNPTEGNSSSNTNMFVILQVISTITNNEEVHVRCICRPGII